MRKPTIRWLTAWPDCTLEILRLISVASLRIRTALGVRFAMAAGYPCKFSDGADDDGAGLVIVGKIDFVRDPGRPRRWLDHIRRAREMGVKVVIDYTDHHLVSETPANNFYREAFPLADVIVCSSSYLASCLTDLYPARVAIVEDPIEVEFRAPSPVDTGFGDEGGHVSTALWFGHGSNLPYLLDYLENGYPQEHPIRLILMSNSYPLAPVYADRLSHPQLAQIETHAVKWSLEDMQAVAPVVDFCLLPAGVDDPRKRGASANRLATALALGLPVAADLLPSYEPFRDYFHPLRGDGMEEFMKCPQAWHPKVIAAQEEIARRFTFDAIGPRWVALIEETLGLSRSPALADSSPDHPPASSA